MYVAVAICVLTFDTFGNFLIFNTSLECSVHTPYSGKVRVDCVIEIDKCFKMLMDLMSTL